MLHLKSMPKLPFLQIYLEFVKKNITVIQGIESDMYQDIQEVEFAVMSLYNVYRWDRSKFHLDVISWKSNKKQRPE